MAKVQLIQEEEVASASAGQRTAAPAGSGECRWFAAHEAAVIQLEKLLHSDLTLGALCDVFSFALPIALR